MLFKKNYYNKIIFTNYQIIMPKTIDWKKYYTIKESSDILDKNIEKSADLLIWELREKREINNNYIMNV